MTYLRTLDAAGAIPVVLPPRRRRRGRCSTGSTASACPAARTSTPPPTARATATRARPDRADLDAFELALARAADERGVPILGICRGVQALNVACGGTLHQHVPATARPSRRPRRRTGAVDDGSQLRRSASARGPCASIPSTTRPSTGWERPARGRAGAGRHDRGRRGARAGFVLGVQWHAEGLVGQPRHRVLFEALVAAAAGAAPSLRAA